MERLKIELENSEAEYLREMLLNKEKELSAEMLILSRMEYENYDVLMPGNKEQKSKELRLLQSLMSMILPNKYY